MNIKKLNISILLFCATFQLLAEDNLVGTFYGGWARNRGNYIWTKDLGQDAQLITTGDVDGDGYEDAITAKNGQWTIALSYEYQDLADKPRRKFNDHKVWLSGFGKQTSKCFSADINGDSKADAIVLNPSSGKWEFALSDGDKFVKSTLTITNFGQGADAYFVADINNDAKADIITYNNGEWKVAVNNGNSFAGPQVFLTAFGASGDRSYCADVDGDGKSDAIYTSDGSIYVALATETGFTPGSTPWKSGLSYTELMFADVNGDNRADAITFNMFEENGTTPAGRWEFYPSGVWSVFGEPHFWCTQHGSDNSKNRPSKGTPHGHHFFTSYVQSPIAGQYGPSPISFNNDVGYWEIMPPYGMFPNTGTTPPGASPNWYCSWQYNNRAGLPRIGDVYYGFDANEDDWAIWELISDLAEAEIDFVLLDQTNGWSALLKAHRLFAQMIQYWNMDPTRRKVRYAIAGKAKNSVTEIEASAQHTWEDFYHTYGTDNYQLLNGKPLLVCYGGLEDKPDQWANYTGSKQYGDKFTLRWMEGDMRYANSSIDFDNVGDWYGWSLWDGSIPNKKQMVVQPGFYNGGIHFSRWENGIEGDRYRRLCWDRVLKEQPKDVTIISFVGDPEQNDVFDMTPGEFLHGMGKTEHWSYPDMYWEMTKDYIQNFKLLKKREIQLAGEYGTTPVKSQFLSINFEQEFAQIPAFLFTLKGEERSSDISINVTSANTTSVSLDCSGVDFSTDTLHWLAILPGNWQTTSGLQISAGIETVDQSTTVQFASAFNHKPSVLSMPNSSITTETKLTQSNISNSSVGFNLNGNKQSVTIGWIAVEPDTRKYWSGRFCAATSSEGSTYYLSEYFYDKAFSLAKANNSDILIQNTNDLGGEVFLLSEGNHQNAVLNTLSFDGKGGCLYARPEWVLGNNEAPNNKKDLKIYPNPVSNQLNIEGVNHNEKASINIYNLSAGKILHTSIYQNNTIDVSHLDSGIYIVHYLSENKNCVLEFIKR